MDNTAVKEIADLGLLQIDKNFAVIRNDQNLASLEPFEGKPWHFRARFETSLVAEFADYVNRHSTQDSAAFVDHLKGAAKAVLDMGSPGSPSWGKHNAHLELIPAPEYKALLDNKDTAKPHLDFIDFVEDNLDCFQFFETGGDLLDSRDTLVKLRTLKLGAKGEKERTVGDYSHFASDIESLEITGAGDQKLPAGFKYVFQPYEGFNSYTADCRLRALADSGTVRLKYRIIGLEALKNDIADELVDKLKEKAGDNLGAFHIGKFSYQ